MRLVVLDTNVLVSAGIRGDGPPGRVVDRVLDGQAVAVVSPKVVLEYRQVIARNKFLRYGFPPLWLEFLIGEALRMEDGPRWPVALPDAADGKFLGLARGAGAVLVTGNLRHYPEGVRAGVVVLSVGGWLERIGEGISADGPRGV